MQKSLTGGAYQAPGFLPRQTIIQEVLDARGLTPAEAARLCGITGPTMAVLYEGYVTLPCLAIKVGHGLGLTRAQVARIGRALDRASWEKRVDSIDRGQEIDFDPAWAEKYRRGRQKMETEEKPSWEVYGKYLDIRKVAEWALAREMSVKEALALAGVQNTSETMDRKGQTQIDAIEHALGYPPGGLRRRTKPDTYRVEVRAEVNRRGLAETMKKRGMNMRRLGAAMGHPPETLWSRLCREKNECSIDLPFARKVADALGVGVKSVFSLEIAEAGKKG